MAKAKQQTKKSAKQQPRPLTPKQQKFVEEYLTDLNATAAARRAGYSENTARVQSCEMLAKPNIQAAIEARRKVLAKNTITPEDVLNEWAKIARLDITDFLGFGTHDAPLISEAGQAVLDADGNPITEPRPHVTLKDSSEVDGAMINEVSLSAKGDFKFKLQDKMKALDSIAKHLGMYVDKVEITGSLQYNIIPPPPAGDSPGREDSQP